MALKFMYITNQSEIAVIAQKYGVDRIWIDLETLGKEERQKNMDCVKSHHTIADIARLRPLLSTSELMVRINPWNENSEQEIEQVIAAGADRVMLPMWKDATEVKAFFNTVCGRVRTTLLLETKEAVACLDDVLKFSDLEEIHIGLNDLHLSFGLTFMFELLANGIIEGITKKLLSAGIPFGFGGIARIGEGMLPAERVITEHYRLGSTQAILSRAFCNTDRVTDIGEIEEIFRKNIQEIREFESRLQTLTEAGYEKNRKEVIELVQQIVKNIQERRKNG